jgi:hypothetical protein
MKMRKPDEAPISAFSSTLTEKPKRGRPTIPDNHLLGARNQWASLLEESWPEIGWPLIQIREHPTSTMDDVRKAFQPVKEKPHNSGLANPFYRETVESATPAEVRRNRMRVQDLQGAIIHAQANLAEIERSIVEIKSALNNATPEQTNTIQTEITRREQTRLQLQSEVNRLNTEIRSLSEKTLDQEAYVYASQLLDFLRSGDRYAIRPLSVANALAGLPTMRWRQSHLRCSKMPPQEARFHYRVLNVILKLWKRRPAGSKESLIEFVKSQLPKLPKKLGYTRDFVLLNWRDLRLAIEECLSKEYEEGETPYGLTSIFMRNAGSQKTSLERMLTEQEKLS